MGNDFLDKTKGTVEKGWDRGWQNLAKADLFTISPAGTRTIKVKPVALSLFSPTGTYELRQEQQQVAVYLRGQQIGVCEHPGQFVLQCLEYLGGITVGVVDRLRERSGFVDIAVVLNLQPRILQESYAHKENKAPCLP